MTIAAASAAVASFSGLRGLAEAAGWPPRLAWLLPLTIDAYAMTSARVWLAASTRTPAARRFARANALGAITASTAGNATYHAIGAGLLVPGWPIVVAVGAVPATVLGLTAHLHALRGRTLPQYGRSVRTRPSTQDGPGQNLGPSLRRTARRLPHRTDADVLDAARAADARYRAEQGRPITRDALRTTLRISGQRATELRRQLAAEPPATTTPAPDRKEVQTT
jgi:Protein of unknown function (DUF2637)